MGQDEPGRNPDDPGSAPPASDPGERPEPTRPALDAQGMQRPAFVLSFPEDPELERLIEAFERGNYALVRREAERLAAKTDDPAVREAALELRRRIEPDPLARYLLLISLLLLVFLVIWAYRVQPR